MMATTKRHWDPAVLIFVIACLLIGWLIKGGVESRTIGFHDPDSGISLSYPAHWVTMAEEGALLAVFDPQTPSTFNTKLTLYSEKWSKELELGNFIVQFSAERGSSLPLYRTISMNPIEVNNLKAMKVEYAYAIDPIGVRAGVTSIPKIVRALDVIVPKDEVIFIFTYAAEEKEYEKSFPAFNTITKSIRIQ
jgi:hypothetical protein